MTTRELNDTQLEELLDLYSHLHEADDPLPARSIIESVWREIRQNPHIKYFGFFVDHTLVSSCTLTVILNLTRGCRPYGVIENVVTHSDYRRKGYGADVLKDALDYAWRKGCYKVMLLTGRKNEEIYRFYESVGFDRHAKQAFVAKPP